MENINNKIIVKDKKILNWVENFFVSFFIAGMITIGYYYFLRQYFDYKINNSLSQREDVTDLILYLLVPFMLIGIFFMSYFLLYLKKVKSNIVTNIFNILGILLFLVPIIYIIILRIK